MSLENLQVHLRGDDETIYWKRMARDGRKIDAIKSLRERHANLYDYTPDLKDAKDILEEYIRSFEMDANPVHISTLKNGKLYIYKNAHGSFRIEVVSVQNNLSLDEAFDFLNHAIRNN